MVRILEEYIKPQRFSFSKARTWTRTYRRIVDILYVVTYNIALQEQEI